MNKFGWLYPPGVLASDIEGPSPRRFGRKRERDDFEEIVEVETEDEKDEDQRDE